MRGNKMTALFQNVKTHWNEPDRAKGNYVPFKEYLTVFFGVGMNYSIKSPLEYLGFTASCFIIMYHYKLPYLAFSVITLIGLPLTYLWNILKWIVDDNLGILEKNTQINHAFCLCNSAVGILVELFDCIVGEPATPSDDVNQYVQEHGVAIQAFRDSASQRTDLVFDRFPDLV